MISALKPNAVNIAVINVSHSNKCSLGKVTSEGKSAGSKLYFYIFFNELQGKVSEYKGGSVGQSSCTCAGCGLSLGHESANAASDDGPADGAVTQAGGAVAAHHQVTTGDEDDGHQLVHAHLAGPLLLQLPQQLLGAGVCRC